MRYLFIVLFSIYTMSCSTFGGGGAVKLKAYKDFELDNGLKVLFVEDRTLPTVNMGLIVRAGSSQDPLSKSGLSSLTADMLERGSKNLNATQIADNFGKLGTSFGIDVNSDYAYFSTQGLSEHQDELLKLFFELVMTPSFTVTEVERMKAEYIASIKRAYDQPSYVAGRAYAQVLYGSHPYGKSTSGSIRDVQSIRQKDIIRHFLRYYRPNNAQLVLVGDWDENIIKKLNALVKDWQPKSVQHEAMPALAKIKGVSLHLVDRADLKQSEVRIGHFGVKRKTDDFLALRVAESIFGGGFTSRLTTEIRVKRGLTYGIGSGFDARLDYGPYTISSNTRHDKVGEMVAETLAVYKKFYEEGVTEEELKIAVNYMKGAFPMMIETPQQLGSILISLRFYDIQDEYITKFIPNLEKITVEDVNKVIKKYYDPNNLKVIVYSPQSQVIKQLRPLGTVEIKNYKEML